MTSWTDPFRELNGSSLSLMTGAKAGRTRRDINILQECGQSLFFCFYTPREHDHESWDWRKRIWIRINTRRSTEDSTTSKK
jgi:hypothetical protein